MSTPILVLKVGTATKKDIELIRKAGVAVIEVEKHDDVRYMDPPLAAITGIEALCFRLVEETLKGKPLYADNAKNKITEYVMADIRGRRPEEVAK